MPHILGKLSVMVISVILLGLVYAFIPLSTDDLKDAKPKPFSSYQQSVRAIQSEQTIENNRDIRPDCKSKFFNHNRKRHKAVVIFHGLSNCPKQFDLLAAQLRARGYNVYIPRIPHHGYTNRLNSELEKLSARELVLFSHQAIDVAQGLGDEVTVIGLSVGGNMAALAAQYREDVDHAMVIAPNLGYAKHTMWANAITRTGLWYPNQYWWWDEKTQIDVPGPIYAYPRYSTRAVAETFKLGWHVRYAADTWKYKARKITVVTNENDEAVNDQLTQELVQAWNKKTKKAVHAFSFAKVFKLNHDIIDPNQPEANTDVVYPRLIELLDNNSRQ